ncbi:MAG: DNA-directed RNA polymerase subunit omega [Eubacteriales bacterium]|jgi:DNA-directed RNA polymerase subunit omega|nr:DNA-directed RNA polymerase subunit omega [Clostridia bacterium]MDZ4043330.1 DNA-directed RNA polymerase subunit omega [Eubacteriales bacterium]
MASMQGDKMMMNRPSLDDLMKKADSRYTLVVVAAKRARILMEKDTEGITPEAAGKPVTRALKEIADEEIRFRPTKEGIK